MDGGRDPFGVFFQRVLGEWAFESFLGPQVGSVHYLVKARDGAGRWFGLGDACWG